MLNGLKGAHRGPIRPSLGNRTSKTSLSPSSNTPLVSHPSTIGLPARQYSSDISTSTQFVCKEFGSELDQGRLATQRIASVHQPRSISRASVLNRQKEAAKRKYSTTRALLASRKTKSTLKVENTGNEELQSNKATSNTNDINLQHHQLPLHCVFKILAVETSPNYFIPWQKKSSKDCIGSGFIVDTPFGVKLLTNAHVVEHATSVRIRRAGSPHMFVAKVKAIANECDLAELVVADQKFYEETQYLENLGADFDETSIPASADEVKEIQPVEQTTKKSTRSKKSRNDFKENVTERGLKLGGLPELHSRVTVVGYPTGGDNISVTRGVVSRIEPQSYTESPAHELLAIQIDAAINPGNSGGPALDDNNNVVGVAFCSLQGAENIGYIIPTPIILHFLEDFEKHGTYTGFVRLGLATQSLDQNPAACEYFKLKKNMNGLLVANVDAVSDAANHVKKDDVLFRVEGVPLANDGTVPFRKRERIHFEYLLMKKYAGDPCRISVWRDGKPKELVVKLKPKLQELVPSHAAVPETSPSYIVYGGIVFTKLTFSYLSEYGDDWWNAAPRNLIHKAIHEPHMFPDQEIVILSHVLVDDCNFGYNRQSNIALQKCNGVAVRNLQHLDELIRTNKEKFIRFDLEEHVTIIMNHQDAIEAEERIKQNHGVPVLSSIPKTSKKEAKPKAQKSKATL